ncbi:restriction endonuclease subunit S [Thiocystis violascens]|uniref:Restriction endonuclease S subunit n=1 Tax=Thiocystis violascens (strain ATCC 17096 / DSM 198 / 6111) TaxID=765911 RepID=I3YFH5_THIV6|nr:restriction endonuclease subunit S [Thiocystis violascens]AFL75743.1 restriction endonuclease S subunit [Thiocystis violascens DSM 198]
MGELFGNEFIGSQEMERIELSAAELGRSGLQDGDLLFGRRSVVEAGAGKCALVVAPTEPLTFESSIIRVRLNQDKANPRFFHYFFASPEGRGLIRTIVSGATVKGIRGSELARLPVVAPPLPLQNTVAEILKAYDDLIENNRRRMALLEESARQIYREWFVRLRFPGHEHTRIIEGVPEGWERTTFGDLCCEIRETVNPEALDPDTAYIGLEHIPRRSIALTEWGTAEQVTSSKHRFAAGDVLFGKIRPYFHKVGIAFLDGVASSDAIVLRPYHPHHLGFVLMTASSDPFVATTAQTMREGSKMPRADWKQMRAYPAPLPPPGLLDSFQATIEPIVEQLRTLTFANQKLRTARDILLPRLMSGEIAV